MPGAKTVDRFRCTRRERTRTPYADFKTIDVVETVDFLTVV